jgi:hypothetical protein
VTDQTNTTGIHSGLPNQQVERAPMPDDLLRNALGVALGVGWIAGPRKRALRQERGDPALAESNRLVDELAAITVRRLGVAS